MKAFATTATEYADGWEVVADDVDVSGCGSTRKAAERDLLETLAMLWEEYSATPAGRLSDDALELFVKLRHMGVGE